MIKEAHVFGGNKGIDKMGRKLPPCDIHAVFDIELAQQLSAGRQYPGGLGIFKITEFLAGLEISGSKADYHDKKEKRKQKKNQKRDHYYFPFLFHSGILLILCRDFIRLQGQGFLFRFYNAGSAVLFQYGS
jgi:hypothetical protein